MAALIIRSMFFPEKRLEGVTATILDCKRAHQSLEQGTIRCTDIDRAT